MLRLALIVVFIGGLLGLGLAHQCQDSSRPKCTAVSSKTPAPIPDQTGYGKNANGYPACSLTGDRLFCLFDHNYHQCASGEAACCMDGSSPSHRHSFTGDDNGLTCSSETSMEKSSPAIVLDDMDSKCGTQMTKAFEGSYAPCMADAYNGQFHHDWACNKGRASFTFKFQAPSDGCYKIEEHHPGNDRACSRYLPTNARLDVEHIVDNTKTSAFFVFNQAQNGGKWSELGSLMFQNGKEAFLKMRSSPGEKCEMQGNCFWVVDAFRLTRTGDKCTEANAATVMKEESMNNRVSGGNDDEGVVITTAATTNQLPAATTTNQLPVQDEITKGKEGTLSLHVSWSDTTTSGSDGLLLQVQKHAGVIESALSASLGYTSVSISSIVASSRRLHFDHPHDGHSGVAHGVALTVSFIAQGETNDGHYQPQKLHKMLITTLQAAKAGITVESAGVYWATGSPLDQPADDSWVVKTIVPAVVVAGFVFVFLGAIAIAVLKQRSSKRSVITVEVAEPDKNQVVMVAIVVEEATKDIEKMKDNDESDSVSTGTPTSEPAGGDASTNSEEYSNSATELGPHIEDTFSV